MTGCETCGGPLPQLRAPGRARRFCSERCRKRQYDEVCVDCGGRVSGTDRKDRAAETRCRNCFLAWQHETRHWTAGRIIAAIQRFHAEHGYSPGGTAWAHSKTKPEYAPWCSIVLREFGTWNKAIAAAGFTPRGVGQYDRARRGQRVAA